MHITPDDRKEGGIYSTKKAQLNYILSLERKIREIETEKEFLKTETTRLERNIRSLISEINAFKEPPLILGTIIDILDDGTERVIVKSSNGSDYVVRASRKILNQNLRPGMSVALNQHTFAVMDILPSSIDPFIKNLEVIESIPDVTYEDIGGLDDVIQEVRETVELPLIRPELFEKIGIDPPKGILLHGPPGTGKTLVAKAVAHHTNATFIRVIGSELVQKYIGEGARYVREVFELARQKAPAILFIDELDAIGAYRMEDSTSGDREVHRTLMQLLSELDGFDNRGDVKFIGATNRIDILDPALLRPGRFDRIVEFPLPDEEAREQIFKIHMRKLNVESKIDYKKLVKMTEGATGADIKAICIEAGMFAIRRGDSSIKFDDFIRSIEKITKKKKQGKIVSGIFL